MRKACIIDVLLVAVLLIMGACPGPVQETTPQEGEASPTPTPELAPDEFKVTSLAVTPIVAEPGQAVTINAEVRNISKWEGSCTLTLTVNGVEEEVKDVIVTAGARETLTFTMVGDASGMYDIEVSGFTETLRVKQPGAYPQLANYRHGWSISYSEALALAKWDLIVVDYRNISYSPESIGLIKKLNPNAKILVWISAGFCLPQYDQWEESWLLHHPDNPQNPKSPEERRVILWTDKTGDKKCVGYNPTSEWSTYLPQFVHDELMSAGLFDGVFYDCVFESMWLNNIDIDNDGVGDSFAEVNQKYQEGTARLLQLTRELLGPEAIIFGNPGIEWSEDSPYWDYANGHMQENALGIQFGSQWPQIWDIYQRNMQKPAPPPRIHWIAVDTNQEEFDNIKPDLPRVDLQKMRFGLAITLLGDGYFGFDEGDGLHGQLWWFPEYDANLGLAVGDAQERSDGSWIREFENGVVVANPTSKESTIEFADIHQDVTTGLKDLRFVVQPEDGRIFVKSE